MKEISVTNRKKTRKGKYILFLGAGASITSGGKTTNEIALYLWIIPGWTFTFRDNACRFGSKFQRIFRSTQDYLVQGVVTDFDRVAQNVIQRLADFAERCPRLRDLLDSIILDRF